MSTSPVMVIVNGLPGTGKTSLAEDIARNCRLPLFRKDECKEILFDTLGWSDKDWSEALDGACYELLWRICATELQAGRSFMIESDFKPEQHAATIARLHDEYDAAAIEILCFAERDVLAERFRERVESGDRHPGHAENDATFLYTEAIPALLNAPEPWLGVTDRRVAVDTTNYERIDPQAVMAWVNESLTTLAT